MYSSIVKHYNQCFKRNFLNDELAFDSLKLPHTLLTFKSYTSNNAMLYKWIINIYKCAIGTYFTNGFLQVRFLNCVPIL